MSLRTRITALSVLVLLAALLASTVLTIRQTTRALQDRGDQELAALASGLRGFAINQVERSESGRRPLQFQALEKLQLPGAMEGYAVVIQADGTVLPLPRLAREPTTPPALPGDIAARAGRETFTIRTPTGDRYRAIAVELPDTDATMVVSLSEDWLGTTTSSLVRVYVLTGLLLVLVFAALIVLVVNVGLRPLRAVTAGARTIAAGQVDQRLPHAPSGTEVGELTDALNTMVDALRHAAEAAETERSRTEQFAADAAHELRTPITAILGYTDLYARNAFTDRQRLDEVMTRIGHEAARLRNLSEDLLTLDLIDPNPHDEHADLVAVARSAAADSQTIDPGHSITIICPATANAQISPDAAFQLLANLLANVRAHTPPGTHTDIAIAAVGDRVTVTVDDDGPGVQSDQLHSIFDRFRRLQPDRTRSPDSGTGLGLAIVSSIALRVGGRASASHSPHGGLRITLDLPLADHNSPAAR